MAHIPIPATSDLDGAKFRESLLDRRRQLTALPQRAMSVRVAELITDVDAALDRLDHGNWGACSRCDGRVEPELMEADPTASVCLDCFTQAERTGLERDLTLASQVQASLLPPRDFSAHGWSGHYLYRPHAVVSGDYVDVVTTEGAAGDLLVLVGDVSGKGIAAALLMSHLHAAFRSMSASGSGLVDMVHKANRLFYASTTSNAFATLTAVSLQSDGRVELCNAGHTPALLITTDGVEEISASSVPLGMFSEAEFTSRSLKLEPGSTMLLYTDGLTESASHDDVELEVEGVRAVLEANRGEGPSNLVSTLADNEANHRSGVEPHDDLTIMAISRQAGRA